MAAGYTAANFSGRMPLVDLADAIVSSGRDTLERAISLVRGNPEWRAEVRSLAPARDVKRL
jgi:DNA polymerase zeta